MLFLLLLAFIVNIVADFQSGNTLFDHSNTLKCIGMDRFYHHFFAVSLSFSLFLPRPLSFGCITSLCSFHRHHNHRHQQYHLCCSLYTASTAARAKYKWNPECVVYHNRSDTLPISVCIFYLCSLLSHSRSFSLPYFFFIDSMHCRCAFSFPLCQRKALPTRSGSFVPHFHSVLKSAYSTRTNYV